MIVIATGLEAWVSNRLQGLRYNLETLAYVAGVMKTLGKPSPEDVFVDRSVVLAFRDATLSGDFAAFQRIGDWVLWTGIVIPESMQGTQDVMMSIGQQSYLSCHRILRGQWVVYQELADTLPELTEKVRRVLV